MYTHFDKLPTYSRIWIFQSNRKLYEKELEEINNELEAFLTHWQTHGENLYASFKIEYHRFILVACDHKQTNPSGCSIDLMIHLIQDFEKRYNISLLDNMNISFRQGDYITYKTPQEFKTMIKNNSISSDTIIFNNIISTIEEYQNAWEIPAKKSWYQKFFTK